jgi:hypothetical protein
MNPAFIFSALISVYGIVPGIFPGTIPFPARITENYQVKIAQESYLVINGNTNVSNFSCAYHGNLYRDTLSVNAELSGDRLRLTNAELNLGTANFDCGIERMNSDFRDLLKAGQYPQIQIMVLDVNKAGQGNIEKYISLEGSESVNLPVIISIAGCQNT